MIDKPGASSPMCEARLWGFRRVSGTRAPLFGHEGTDVANRNNNIPYGTNSDAVGGLSSCGLLAPGRYGCSIPQAVGDSACWYSLFL
jgi:hypothetical protein